MIPRPGQTGPCYNCKLLAYFFPDFSDEGIGHADAPGDRVMVAELFRA